MDTTTKNRIVFTVISGFILLAFSLLVRGWMNLAALFPTGMAIMGSLFFVVSVGLFIIYEVMED